MRISFMQRAMVFSRDIFRYFVVIVLVFMLSVEKRRKIPACTLIEMHLNFCHFLKLIF